jgi:hypothetical protein
MREQALYVKRIVMGKPMAPPYDYALDDDWTLPPLPLSEEVPVFLKDYHPDGR